MVENPDSHQHIVEDMLRGFVESGASDLLIAANSPAQLRESEILRVCPGSGTVNLPQILQLMQELTPATLWEEYQERGETTFCMALGAEQRFRVRLLAALQSPEIHFHRLPASTPSIEQLKLPDAALDRIGAQSGMLLVTGPRNSGRTSLLAALVDALNTRRRARIITLERPVEIVQASRLAAVSQRDIRDFGGSYESALRSALRESPDVIVVSQLVEPGAIKLAIEAMGSGTLVVAGMPFRDCRSAISQLVESQPPDAWERVRELLADHLHLALAQSLVAQNSGPDRVAVRELLLLDDAVAHQIESGDWDQLAVLMAAGNAKGMVELNQALIRLVQANEISVPAAYGASANRHQMAVELQKSGIGLGALPDQERSLLEYASAPVPTSGIKKPSLAIDPGRTTTRALKRRGWF